MILLEKDNPEIREFWRETSCNIGKWAMTWLAILFLCGMLYAA